MNTILMSIRPEYLVKILNGEKDEEIRKSVPKEFVRQLVEEKKPFKVVMYMTKSKPYLVEAHKNGKAIQMTKGWQTRFKNEYMINGKVVGEFICDKVERIQENNFCEIKNIDNLLTQSCLSVIEFKSYLKYRETVDYGIIAYNLGFALHISNVVAYDKPKELGFYNVVRAPQSWQYIEVEK